MSESVFHSSDFGLDGGSGGRFDSRAGELLDTVAGAMGDRDKRHKDSRPTPTVAGGNVFPIRGDSGAGSDFSSDSGGDSASDTKEVGEKSAKTELAPEDKYVNNEGRMAYDAETAQRYADRVHQRAREIAVKRVNATDEIGTELDQNYGADVAARAAELALVRVNDATDKEKSQVEEFARRVANKAVEIAAKKAKKRNGDKKPLTEDFAEADEALQKTFKGESRLDSQMPLAEEYAAADNELSARFGRSRLEEAEVRTEDYAQAEAELRSTFEKEALENAQKHAEVMKAGARKGYEYQTMNDSMDAGAVNVDKIVEENKLPIETVLAKAGKNKAEIAAILKGIESGDFDEAGFRNLPEVVPSDQRSRAEVISDAMELSVKYDSTEEADVEAWKAHSAEFDKMATIRVDDTDLGVALKSYIDSHPGDSAEGMRRTWRGHERDILTATFEIKSLYGQLEQSAQRVNQFRDELLPLEERFAEMTKDLSDEEIGENEGLVEAQQRIANLREGFLEAQKDKQLLEAEMRASLRRLSIDRDKFEYVTKQIAEHLGYKGEMPNYKQAKEVKTGEISGILRGELANGQMMSMLRESMKNGRLTREAIEFFTRAGILESAEDAFEQIYYKNWRTHWGEALQRAFGGRGNEIPRSLFTDEDGNFDEEGYAEARRFGPQLTKNEKLFKNFMESEQGYMCLDRLAEAMQESIINADRLKTAVARTERTVSPDEILEYFARRDALRGEVLARQRGVRTETSGQAAAKAFHEALGRKGELTIALRSVLARITGSNELLENQYDVDGDEVMRRVVGREWQQQRVSSRYSFRDIIERGSTRTAEALQRVRVGWNQIVTAVEYIEPLARAFEHGVVTETPRALGVKNALNLHHETTRDSQGRSQERHREARLRTGRIRAGIDRIISRNGGRNAA